ncbi:endonuclease III [uncultured Fibrella sp.]|uniref:endonuclease III n=1 Tax=uncultured Fibrella sp. TaxID=1284596 RepID=UPI0035CBD8CD
MLKKERFRRFIDYFTTHFPEPETELQFGNSYELLVAVILSAQCTDKRINQITPALFARFPEAESLAAASVEEVFTYIRSVSYPNNKAKHLVGMARMLMSDFGGDVPGTVEELQRLPGVGRKTAHVILSIVFNQPTMAVDTHVFRVSHRIGLAPLTATTPLAVEKALMAHIPKQYVPKAHHWLILHGRYICIARSPKCGECALRDACKYYEKVTAPAALSRKTT